MAVLCWVMSTCRSAWKSESERHKQRKLFENPREDNHVRTLHGPSQEGNETCQRGGTAAPPRVHWYRTHSPGTGCRERRGSSPICDEAPPRPAPQTPGKWKKVT